MMVGPTEIAHSRALIARAHKRLEYQQAIVAKLGFDREPRHRDMAYEVQAAMRAKLDLLIRHHDNLVTQADIRTSV